jgi:hypothetical protein
MEQEDFGVVNSKQRPNPDVVVDVDVVVVGLGFENSG